MSFSSLTDFAEYFILLEIVAFQKKYESVVIVTYFWHMVCMGNSWFWLAENLKTFCYETTHPNNLYK